MPRWSKYLWLLLVLSVWTSWVSAQSVLDRSLSIDLPRSELSAALFELSLQSKINISFGSFPQLDRTVGPYRVVDRRLGDILDDLLINSRLGYKVIGQQIVLFRLPPAPPARYTIKGYLEDDINGEKLISANIYDPTSYRGTSTNVYGFYSLTLPAGPITLTYSYLGFLPQTVKFDLQRDTMINLSLKSDFTLAEVVVLSTDSLTTQKFGNLSRDEISLDKVQKFPTLMGESDVMRTAFLLPGVQSGGDGVGGLFVRGGNADQNLVLLDGVPVYNATHLVGIFSIFNSSAIRSANLIKGSFPARYGGRLSSVLDVRTKEGNQKDYEAELGLGLITGKFSFEGPIVKDRSAFFLSYRRSFLDLIMRPLTRYINRNNGGEGFSAYGYQDFNAKINATLSDRDEIFLSFYAGGDDFRDESLDLFPEFTFKTQQLINWGNNIASFRWNHQFGEKLFANTTITFSEYDFQSENFVGIRYNTADSLEQSFFFANRYQSTIEDLAVKLDFDYLPKPEHYIRYGFQYTRHKFQPRIASVNENNDIGFGFDSNPSSLSQLFGDSFIESFEGAAYVEDEINIRRELQLSLGLRASFFRTGSQVYWALQPRLAAQFFIRRDWALSVSFARMRQHLHLLTRTGIGLPEDLWVPSTENIRPQDSWQGVVGLKFVPAARDAGWEAGFEAYFKQMDQVLAYQEGTLFTFIDGENWEENVTVGRGWAYGVEFFGSRNLGKTLLLCNATLAWSQRQFDELSSGQRFDFRYDRRFYFKAAGVHRFSKRFELSLSWVYGTGNGITLPTSVSEYLPENGVLDITQPFLTYNFGARNAFRMEAYHRFDFGLNFHSQKSWGDQTFSAGIYNLYNRRNPLFITLRPRDQDPEQSEFVQYSLIPLLPQVSYSLRIKNWKKQQEEEKKVSW